MKCPLGVRSSILSRCNNLHFSNKDKKIFQQRLVRWFKIHQRNLPWRKTDDPYKIWISEVMLQQTQVATALPYYLRFIHRFPVISDLAEADLETVLKMWEGLGYYARARNFHKAAGMVVEKFNGQVPVQLEIFKTLPGVGDYIGAAVQSIAFNHPHAVVDGNVKRVLARLFCLDTPVNHASSHKKFLKYADSLLLKKKPGMFNQAMMELGALICSPKTPRCQNCPVSGLCEAFSLEKTALFPKRIKSKKVPVHTIAVGIIADGQKILITRRPIEGLLGGLWEFPGGKVENQETSEAACIREIKEETGLGVKITGYLTRIHHAYTHFKIKMDVFYCRKINGRTRLNGPIDHRWISLGDIGRFAFPKANNKFIPLIEKHCLFKTPPRDLE